MIFLLLCILFSVAVLVTFKFAEYFKVNAFSAILVNYVTVFLIGFTIAQGNITPLLNLNTGNILFLFGLGIGCITVFRLLSLCIQHSGVAITTIASKMSVIIPVLFSVYIDNNDSLNSLKIFGISLALISVLLTVLKKDRLVQGGKGVYLPILIFIGIGAIDSSIKYAQTTFVTKEMNSIFNSAIFAVSGRENFNRTFNQIR